MEGVIDLPSLDGGIDLSDWCACLPLSYSGGPGVNGVPYRGVNGERLGQEAV